MARLFISTLKAGAFEWFMKLFAGSIKIWANLEKLFLTRFIEDDTEISVPTLLVAKQMKESLSKLSSRDFGAWHSVVPVA